MRRAAARLACRWTSRSSCTRRCARSTRTAKPPFRARPFDVQLIGGLVLYEGKIAEMATGEGKTFVAPLACFLRVLEGCSCHVVTVNDYLVRRDATGSCPAFENLGLTRRLHPAETWSPAARSGEQYECDITYGTNSEFGFDYLRDNMKERDGPAGAGAAAISRSSTRWTSILIDEARTPLIISGAGPRRCAEVRAGRQGRRAR